MRSAEILTATRAFGLLMAIAWGAVGPVKTATAQEDAEIVELSRRVKGFLAGIAQPETVNRSFQDLLAGGPLAAEESVQKLTGRVQKFGQRFGAFLEAEQIAAKRVGQDLVLMRFLYKAERFPVVWHVAFYRPVKGNREDAVWTVIRVSFDTDLRLLALGER